MSFLRTDGLAREPYASEQSLPTNVIPAGPAFLPPIPPFVVLSGGQGFNLECVVGWNYIGDTDPAATSIAITINAGAALQQLKATGEEAKALNDLLVTLSAYRVEGNRWTQQASVSYLTGIGPNG